MSEKPQMINATGLWVNTNPDGLTYMAGSLGGVRVLIFKNTRKTKDSEPDYTLCFAPNQPKEKREPGSNG